MFSFDGLVDSQENLAFRLGDRAAAVTSGGRRRAPLVRPHSECLTGGVFGSQRCNWPQLREAVERIADSGGFLLCLRQEGFGVTVAARVPTGMHLSAANARSGRRRREGLRVRSTSRCQRGEIALC